MNTSDTLTKLAPALVKALASIKGATKDAKRLPIKEAPTITRIPVLPISYADALPLLRALAGPVAPEE